MQRNPPPPAKDHAEESPPPAKDHAEESPPPEAEYQTREKGKGSSGGSLVATPDCEAAVLGSNPAISPAYSGLPVLRWAAISDGTLLKAVL
jgi:hypothetical protein